MRAALRLPLVLSVLALSDVAAASATPQPIPRAVIRHLRGGNITLRLAPPSEAKVALSQAVAALGTRARDHRRVGGWLVRFTDEDYAGPGGTALRRRLAWLIVVRDVLFPTPFGTPYKADGCWFVDGISGRFLLGSSC